MVDGVISPLGSLQSLPVDKVREKLSVKIGSDQASLPLATEDLSNDAQTLLAVMKPVFGKMLGDFGKGMELICFKGQDDQGKNLLDPKQKGHFVVLYGDKAYSWRLPLGSLLPPKYDAETGEQFPGDYEFNPFTGAKLGTTKPNKAS